MEIASLQQNNSISTKEKLCTIIQKQSKFKAFKISQCESLLKDVLLSLEFQKHSLVYIEFDHIYFDNVSFKKLITLCNLKYLKFEACKALSLEQCNLLNFASFKLEELSLINNNWDDKITLSMIKYLGESLKKSNIIIRNLKGSIIEYLSTYCLNLTSLKIGITSYIDLLVFPYFKNLKTRMLILDILNNIPDKIFVNLAKNLPINVKEISICFYHSHYYIHFEMFLENYFHHNLEIINLNNFIQLEYLKIILNYIERSNNSLKFLGMIKTGKVFNDEESKLLDQIKEKGVTLVDFYSIIEKENLILYHLI